MMLAHNNYSISNQTQQSSTTSASPFNYQQQQQHIDIDLDIDFDGLDSVDSESIASQSSLPSQYSFQNTPLSTTFPPRVFKFPPTPPPFEGGIGQSLTQEVPDLMPSADPWLLHSQQHTPRGALRMGHNRESSLSSLGSNGPASPYHPSTSNPQIAITDSNSEGYHDLSGGDAHYSYQAAKPLSLNDHFYTSLPFGGAHGAGSMDAPFAEHLPNMSAQQQQHRPRHDRSLLPPPELSIGSIARSHPVSVASSIAGGDSPATPSYQEPIEEDRRRKNNGFTTVPKLDRTMTDIYSDELYSPNFTITSASPVPQSHLAMSPSNELFAQRLQAANSQHLNIAHSSGTVSSRNNSPFRNGSPLAPSLNDFSPSGNQVRVSSAQQLREKRKVEQDAKALQQHIARSVGQQQQQQGTPSTISPKDAMLEFNDTDDASNFPLFPVHETNNYNLNNQVNKVVHQQQQQSTQVYQPTTPLQSAFNFNMPTNIQVPQQYPFVARPRQQQQVTPSISTFSRMSSADTNGSENSTSSSQRPARTGADGGTYTCTYHGCTQRFETPALLQKHKREGHRQANALSTARASVTATSPSEAVLNSQAGPHRCDRINPSTGKPCSTVFSRPYDLTRHEDTIHNARKQKVRCNLCTEDKTFSRADALTRHYRVCHPDVEFPGKHRRRGGSAV